ncbi:prepilin-type N-terminal cleavage/methylation domain-containing protein [Vibrio sp. RE86]|uniref:type IV pilin protein n=1 Tax=Vibrio sp. RE86 TaxID=2607605 RepID=UPI001493C5D5|nr:prepilin-type N-terminal cleavage/methylation domain-containing protein [Vibrio sp. RE86]
MRRSGFTLVELIITILILSVIAVVAYPRLPSFSGYALDGYCSELKSGLRRVQTQAMNDIAASGAYSVTSSNIGGVVSWSQPELNLDSSPDCVGPSCSQIMRFSEEDTRRGVTINSQFISFDNFGRLLNSSVSNATFTIDAPSGESTSVTINLEGYIGGC